jgi:hypothetical protein
MPIHRRLFGGLVVLAPLLLPSIASAQTATAAIAGVVKDTTGAILPGVTVEASSPALIEKTRTTVTDAQGNFKILELRPGTYTVTFTLPGFSTVKRESLELPTGFTANVSVELKVGAVEETVTVTGASPIVDVQNVRYQQALEREAWDALPTGKNLSSYVALTLGATTSATSIDVGGTSGRSAASFTFHGAGINDQALVVDGMDMGIQSAGGGPWTRNTQTNERAYEERTIGSGMSADQEAAGIVINLVPRDGGNLFSGTFALNGSSGSLQGNNLTPDLVARGVPVQGKVTELYDVGSGAGGPIRKDRLWFYGSDRWWQNRTVIPGSFYNATPQPAYGLIPVYTPDVSRPGKTNNPNHNDDLRVTWQMAKAHKIAFFMELQSNCACDFGVSNSRAPEAGEDLGSPYGTKNVFQTTWTYVKGNRWLFSAGNSTFYSGGREGTAPGSSTSPTAIPMFDLNTGFLWNAFGQDPFPIGACCSPFNDGVITGSATYLDNRYSATYSTGSHTFKVGARIYDYWSRPSTSSYNNTPYGAVELFVRGGVCLTPGCTPSAPVPASVLLLVNPQGPATPGTGGSNTLVTALYAQEQWTLKRLTLNLGGRFDSMNNRFNTYTTVANNYQPSFTFPELDNSPNWKDISPRLGVAYDLFGNGRTAIKGSVGRFVVHQSDAGSSPSSLLGYGGGTRTWNDTNHNFVPDCNLSNPLANGECGPLPNINRGVATAQSTFFDNAWLAGWNHRPDVWTSSLSVSQELRRGLGVTVGYFHTTNGNLSVTWNRAVLPSDYSSYCVSAPMDSRLGSSSGSQICGLYDLNPSKFGQVNNLITQASQFGNVVNKYDGVDVSLNARFGKGGVLQGGVSTAKTVVDTCALNSRPDVTTTQTAGTPRNSTYCSAVATWGETAQIKLLGAYPLPWWGLQVSGTFQNLPGPNITASQTYTSAQIAPSLGRPLSSGATGTVSIALLPPNTLFDSRISEADFRLTKTIQMRRLRAQGQFDMYNLFNSSAVLAESGAYGAAWQRPSAVIPARLFKFGVQLDWK